MSKVVEPPSSATRRSRWTPTCTSSAAITCRGWCRGTGISSQRFLPDAGAGRAVVVQEPEDSEMEGAAHGAPLFDRVVGLTGTPAPNGLTDLWAELYLLDMGEAVPTLGKVLTRVHIQRVAAEITRTTE